MSVKIYNGYLLNIKPEEIFDKTNEIREKLSYVGMCLYADMINSILYEEYDRRSKGEEESIKTVLKKYIDENDKDFSFNVNLYPKLKLFTIGSILEKKIKEAKISDLKSSFDISCLIQIIKIEDKILALIYTQNNEYINEFEKISFVKEYNYWNNTDKPDDISSQEWEERNRIWDLVFKYGYSDRVGFTIDCLPMSLINSMTYNNKKLLEYPNNITKEKRANAILDKDAFIRKYTEENNLPYKDEYDILRLFTDKNFISVLKQKRKEIADTLTDITIEKIIEKSRKDDD